MELSRVIRALDNADNVLAKTAFDISKETPRRMKMMLEFSAEEIRQGIPGFNKFVPERYDVTAALESAARGADALAMHFAGKTMPPATEYPALTEVINRWSATAKVAVDLLAKVQAAPAA